LRRLWIAALCIGLTSFSCGCRSAAGIRQEWLDADKTLAPPLPSAPEPERVQFEDRDGGLWLPYSDYRALERNVIAMQEYIHQLEIVIRFYAQGK